MKTRVLHKLPAYFIVGPNVTGWFRDRQFMARKAIGTKRAGEIIRACIADQSGCQVEQVCEDTPKARRLMGRFLREVDQPRNLDDRTVFNSKTKQLLQYPKGAAFIEIQDNGKLTLYLPAKLPELPIHKKMHVLDEKGCLVPALAA